MEHVRIVLAKVIVESAAACGTPGHRIDAQDSRRVQACVWLNRGTRADVAKARVFADQEGYAVFVYPSTERDYFDRAKREALATTMDASR